MNKSELIELISERSKITKKKAEDVVNLIFDSMTRTMARGGRIEIRGFGSFAVRRRSPRVGRNPRTGQAVPIPEKLAAHFKPGKALRTAVDAHGKLSQVLQNI